jgi:WD40 repeat protein
MSDSDDDSSQEFYDVVSEVPPQSPEKGDAEAHHREHVTNEEHGDNDDDNNDDEEKDHFEEDNLSISECGRNRTNSSLSDIVLRETSGLFNSGKSGFSSSIRSLFGNMSNVDSNFELDLDAEMSDDDDNKDEKDTLNLSSPGIKERKDRDRHDTPTARARATGGLKSTGTVQHPAYEPRSDSSSPPTPPPRSIGSSIWHFFLGGAKHASHADPMDVGGGDKTASAAPAKKTGVKLSLVGKKQPTYHHVHVLQELEVHHGPVWAMRFSQNGHFLATGGQDGKAIVWSVGFDRRASCLVDIDDEDTEERLHATPGFPLGSPTGAGGGSARFDSKHLSSQATAGAFIFPVPCRVFAEHDGHIVDLSWSASNFLLTACLDKSVRLWHVKR